MQTRKTVRTGVPKHKSTKPSRTEPKKPVALTVKLEDAMYVRLCTLGATQRRTNQDMLREAIEEYLDREGA